MLITTINKEVMMSKNRNFKQSFFKKMIATKDQNHTSTDTNHDVEAQLLENHKLKVESLDDSPVQHIEVEKIISSIEINNNERTTNNMVKRAEIVESMIIRGNISLEAPATIAGKIYGDVLSTDIISSNPGLFVQGNVVAKAVEIIGGEIIGEVECYENIYIDSQSKITGMIMGQDIEIAGEVEGDILATGNIKLGKTAKVIGKLTSNTIAIDAGAQLISDFTKTNHSFASRK